MYAVGIVRISKKLIGKYIFAIAIYDLGWDIGGNLCLTWYSNK